MLAEHKVATAVGAIGLALVLAHVMLGPDVVPLAVAGVGAAIAAAAGLFIALARRRKSAGPEDRSGRGTEIEP